MRAFDRRALQMGNVRHKGSLERNSREGGGVAEEKLGRGHGEHMVSEGASRAWAC